MLPRLANIALGIWLMAAPAVLDYAGRAANNDRIAGPLAASFATIAIWEATRPLRWANVLLGAWLLLAPWLLGYEAPATIANDMVSGLLLIAFALVRGKIETRFGGGWSALWPATTSDQGES